MTQLSPVKLQLVNTLGWPG